jgi:hypothetical protein
MHSTFEQMRFYLHTFSRGLCSFSNLPRLLALPVLATCLHSQQAIAQAKKDPPKGPKFSADIAVGFEYDSNIAVEEVDRSSSETDYALTLSAGLGLQQK